ncbi:MAG: radical SAM protein [Theionarchaea archaeon]|nr:radical SAM protein [Theionarchaea archaeon]MBU7037332.1 radical SAM protein [Theionarchaea archaeon]
MQYLRVTKTPIVRRMPLGTYACFPSGFQLESFYPIMEIDGSIEEVLTLCDGTRTREDILNHLAAESGESVEEVAEGFDQFVEYMVQEGVLEWREEPSLVEPLYRENRPFSITIDITSACNLQCDFCSADSGAPRGDDLTMEHIDPLLEQVKKCKPTPFAISGGEPLLKKEMVLHILEELASIRETAVTIFTNATLVNRDYAQQLYDAGLRYARVSVDGHTAQVHDAIRGKGTFQKTTQGIQYLRELGIHVNTVSVISKTNYQYLGEIRHFVNHIADSYGLAVVQEYGRGAESGHLLLSEEERFNVNMSNLRTENIQTNVSPRDRCNVGETIYIRANGDIFPCFYLQFPEFRVGNIKENDLFEIYEHKIMKDLLKMTVADIEECRECEIRYYCGGACRGFAYLEHSSVHVPDPLNCEKNKTIVRMILEKGEENTKQLLREVLDSTSALG